MPGCFLAWGVGTQYSCGSFCKKRTACAKDTSEAYCVPTARRLLLWTPIDAKQQVKEDATATETVHDGNLVMDAVPADCAKSFGYSPSRWGR